MTISVRDIAWLAGLWEGEGTFGFYNTSQWGAIQLKLAMTDKDVVERAAYLMRGKCAGPYISKTNPRWKPVWHVVFYGHKAAGWMMTLYSLLGERRKKQIEHALEQWKAQSYNISKRRHKCAY